MGYDYRTVIIYVDVKDNLFIVPTGESKRLCGATMELDLLKHLAFPYSDVEVEETLLKAMELCFSMEPDDAPGYRTVMEKYLNVKGYAKAVKDKKCIIFHWDVDDGYSVTATQKVPKEGYVHLKDKAIQLGKDIKKGELVKVLKEAIQLSTP